MICYHQTFPKINFQVFCKLKINLHVKEPLNQEAWCCRAREKWDTQQCWCQDKQAKEHELCVSHNKMIMVVASYRRLIQKKRDGAMACTSLRCQAHKLHPSSNRTGKLNLRKSSHHGRAVTAKYWMQRLLSTVSSDSEKASEKAASYLNLLNVCWVAWIRIEASQHLVVGTLSMVVPGSRIGGTQPLQPRPPFWNSMHFNVLVWHKAGVGVMGNLALCVCMCARACEREFFNKTSNGFYSRI